MTATVPEVIVVGKTRYRHYTRGSRDLYAPETLLPDPPLEHVWSYCVSRQHNNTVYFHNDGRGTSLWVLPDLGSTPSKGEEEGGGGGEITMQAIGSVASAASRQKRDTSMPAASESVGDVERRGRRAVMQESIAKAVKQTLEKNQPPTNGLVKTLSADNMKKENNRHDSNSNNEDIPRDEVDDTTHVRHRLALWRAKRDQQQEGVYQERSVSSSAHGSSSRAASGLVEGDTNNEHPLLGIKPQKTETFFVNGVDSHAPYDASEGPVGSAGDSLPSLSQDPQQRQEQQQQQESASLERSLYDDKRVLFLKATEELQREREAVLEKERLAIQRARCLQEIRQQEEEERTRLATERRMLEQRRVELQRRAIERQNELLAKAEEEAMQHECIAQLNSFAEKQRRLAHQAEEEGRRIVSFEKAIANSLLATISEETNEPVKERRIDLRLIEESDEDEDDNKQHGVHQKNQTTRSTTQQRRHQPPPQEEREKSKQPTRIAFSPSLVYVGDVTGGGGNAPEFLQRRHGRGKYFYDAAQKSFFEGEWKDDKRNGNGLLSLPHVAVEGVWRDDKLHGRAMYQSRRLKGTSEFVDNVIEGSTIVELDCNSVFAGKVKKNGAEIVSGAITLSSGDHVEWVVDEQGEQIPRISRHNDSRSSTTNKINTNVIKKANVTHGNSDGNNQSSGTGRCRIHFSNSDVFIGEVKNYRPHGTGTYRFAATVHEYVGEFYHGFLQGRGTYRFANGNVYVGQLYKGLFHGEGEYVHQDAYTYEGSWEYGTAHGKGKLTFVNGDVWEGEFDHDKRLLGRYTESRLFQL